MVKAKKAPKQANPLAVRQRKSTKLRAGETTEENKKKKKRFRKGKRLKKHCGADDHIMLE